MFNNNQAINCFAEMNVTVNATSSAPTYSPAQPRPHPQQPHHLSQAADLHQRLVLQQTVPTSRCPCWQPPHPAAPASHLEPDDSSGTVPDFGADDLRVALVLELVMEALPGAFIRVGNRHLETGPECTRCVSSRSNRHPLRILLRFLQVLFARTSKQPVLALLLYLLTLFTNQFSTCRWNQLGLPTCCSKQLELGADMAGEVTKALLSVPPTFPCLAAA